VELTVALHYVLDTPRDILIWDVGHQSYGHKILTGRNDRFETLRQEGGSRDSRGARRANTTLRYRARLDRDLVRAGLRLLAGSQEGNPQGGRVVGDGALTGGLAFEGLNQAGVVGTDLLVVLNDNSMSISKNVGAIARYLTRITSAPVYRRLEIDVWELLGKVPAGGKARAWHGESRKVSRISWSRTSSSRNSASSTTGRSTDTISGISSTC